MSIIKFDRTIRRSGRSSVVAIPPELMKALSWTVGDQVQLSATDKGILIEKAS